MGGGVVRAPHLVDCASVIGMTHELGTGMVDGVFCCVSLTLFSLSLSLFGPVVVRSLEQITSAAQNHFQIFFFLSKEEINFASAPSSSSSSSSSSFWPIEIS